MEALASECERREKEHDGRGALEVDIQTWMRWDYRRDSPVDPRETSEQRSEEGGCREQIRFEALQAAFFDIQRVRVYYSLPASASTSAAQQHVHSPPAHLFAFTKSAPNPLHKLLPLINDKSQNAILLISSTVQYRLIFSAPNVSTSSSKCCHSTPPQLSICSFIFLKSSSFSPPRMLCK